MAKLKITLSDVIKRHLKLISYLLVSGLLAWILAKIAGRPELVTIFAPAINYALKTLEDEIKGEGVVKALENKK